MKKVILAMLAAIFCAACCFVASADAMTAVEYYRLAKKYKKINAFAATVQSAHETGNWTSYLWKNAYNGAGMKAQPKWINAGKPYITIVSAESSGKSYSKKASQFRKYRSPKDFLRDYELKISEEYPRSWGSRNNIWGYFAGLYHGRWGKWATDHKYYELLVKKTMIIAPHIYKRRWKLILLKQYKAAVRHKLADKWQINIIRTEFREAGII